MSVFLNGSRLPCEPLDEDVQRAPAAGINSIAILHSINPGYMSEPERHLEEQGNCFVKRTEG